MKAKCGKLLASKSSVAHRAITGSQGLLKQLPLNTEWFLGTIAKDISMRTKIYCWNHMNADVCSYLLVKYITCM